MNNQPAGRNGIQVFGGTLDSTTTQVDDGWQEKSLRRSINTTVVPPEADTVKIKCVAEHGHQYHDSELGRDFNFGLNTELMVPARVGKLLLTQHPQKFDLC